jgi:2-aminoadipate transaminase
VASLPPGETGDVGSLSTLYAPRAHGITGSVIDSSTSLLAHQSHDVVRLAMGSPAPEAIPSPVFATLLAELAGAGDGAFDYGATEGDPALREALLAFLSQQGAPVAAEELLITSGGMQGLDLVCKLFVGPGDLVAVESPTYTNGTAAIAGYEGEMLEVAGDADGMDVEALARLVAERGVPPKLIYTIPTFQNPSGTTLSLARRERLIDLAAQWGAVVLEDDPYSLLRFEGEPLPSLRELGAGRAQVIAVHTFSKILAPGLRVGWVVAEPDVIVRMIAARQSMDTCTAPPMQRLVARFLDEGLADAHLEGLRVAYRERKRAMQQALADELGHLGTDWTDPHGGFFLWLTLPEAVDTQALFPHALAEGVAYIPGSAFSISGRFANALRLAFSAEPPHRARDGVRRLHRAIEHQLATT